MLTNKKEHIVLQTKIKELNLISWEINHLKSRRKEI